MCRWIVAAIAVAVAGAPAYAQVPCFSNGVVMFAGIIMQKNPVPFTATGKTTFEQKLPDGNRIHAETITHQARDSGGRTWTESTQGCDIGEDGQSHPRKSIQVYDPKARTTMNWQVDLISPKVVRVYHQDPPSPNKSLTPEEIAEQQKRAKLAMLQNRAESHTEQLGTRDFHGQTAQGTRTTRTIPAGQEGNDLPLVTVTERWLSRDLGLTLMSVTDDPRRGKTTFEYEELNLGEPDPSLFVAPEGYKVIEVHPDLGMQ
jgi:hypothetical protein